MLINININILFILKYLVISLYKLTKTNKRMAEFYTSGTQATVFLIAGAALVVMLWVTILNEKGGNKW